MRRGSLHPLDLAWGAFAAVMLALTWYAHYGMTIPYHLLFVSFALVYGFRLWALPVSGLILTVITVVTGGIFLRAYVNGEIGADELTEVPLMPLIVAFMVWHGLRRVAAQRQVEELAALEGSRVARQREFLRDTSHAIRTPVTIARGYVELLSMRSDEPTARDDAAEVLHQMDRLNELAGRLLLMEALDTTGGLTRGPVDIGSLVTQVGQRWRGAARRRWVVESDAPVTLAVDSGRLEEALDALVENALRFTGEGDIIRLSACVDGGQVVLEVADSGPGVPAVDRERVFDRFFHRPPAGQESGTGLGLALVRSIVRAHDGTVTAGAALEGGALFVVTLPADAPGRRVAAGGQSSDALARMPRQLALPSSDLPATP